MQDTSKEPGSLSLDNPDGTNSPCTLSENRTATAANIEKFLQPVLAFCPLTTLPEEPTIPVSADRCWDWKNTASVSLQLGHCLFDLGSCNETPRQQSWS